MNLKVVEDAHFSSKLIVLKSIDKIMWRIAGFILKNTIGRQ